MDTKLKKKEYFYVYTRYIPEYDTIITPKNEPFSQEMRLKIQLLSRGFKLADYKPGWRVSAVHIFVK